MYTTFLIAQGSSICVVVYKMNICFKDQSTDNDDHLFTFVLQDDCNPLMAASPNGHLDVATTLIGAGADVNHADKVVNK